MRKVLLPTAIPSELPDGFEFGSINGGLTVYAQNPIEDGDIAFGDTVQEALNEACPDEPFDLELKRLRDLELQADFEALDWRAEHREGTWTVQVGQFNRNARSLEDAFELAMEECLGEMPEYGVHRRLQDNADATIFPVLARSGPEKYKHRDALWAGLVLETALTAIENGMELDAVITVAISNYPELDPSISTGRLRDAWNRDVAWRLKELREHHPFMFKDVPLEVGLAKFVAQMAGERLGDPSKFAELSEPRALIDELWGIARQNTASECGRSNGETPEDSPTPSGP